MRIVSRTLRLDGIVLAEGTGDMGSGGSGGSIYVAVGILQGSGTIRASGGAAGGWDRAAGGGGRVAVYAQDFSGFPAENITAPAGSFWGYNGGAGTVYLRDTDEAHGTLIVDAGAGGNGWTPLGLPGKNYFPIGGVVVIRGANTRVGAQNAGLILDFQNALIITNGAVLTINGDWQLSAVTALQMAGEGSLTVNGAFTSDLAGR